MLMSASTRQRVEDRLVYAHGLAAIITLLISVAFGILAATKLIAPDLADDSPRLTWSASAMTTCRGLCWAGSATRSSRSFATQHLCSPDGLSPALRLQADAQRQQGRAPVRAFPQTLLWPSCQQSVQ